MFRRRIFYDNDGKVLRHYMALGGDGIDPNYTAKAEALEYGYKNWLEWDEPDAEIESAASPIGDDGKWRRVSITVLQGVPVFTYSPWTAPTEDEMREALSIMGVQI